MSKLMDIEGIGEKYAKKLAGAGIKTTRDLLNQGASTQGRKAIAENSSISEKNILEWVNHLDLFRIKGVGGEYADLLEEAGVDTVVELAQRNPDNLYKRLLTVNQEKKLVRKLPTPYQVKNWIDQAAKLPRGIFY